MKKKPIADPRVAPNHSQQWQSESTLAAKAPPKPRSSPSHSEPPDPCKGCHVVVKKKEVSVAWGKQPKNTYGASGNINTAKGGRMPDQWTISGAATIDKKSGAVTFGAKGETVTITGTVKKCPKCTASFTLNIIQLSIMFDGNDVTDTTVPNLEVGNFINPIAQVTPGTFQPPGDVYAWSIPARILADFHDAAPAHPVEPFGGAKKKDPKFFWLDGGDKAVSVKLKTKGVDLAASATFAISRPDAQISASVIQNPAVENQPGGKGWRMTPGGVAFKIDKLNHGSGATCWTQMLTYFKIIHKVGALIWYEWPAKGISDGLDTEFKYDSGATSRDTPDTSNQGDVPTWIQYDLDCTMYLMYQSTLRASAWVPLRSVFWQGRGRASGPPSAPTASYVLDSSSFVYAAPADSDQTTPPNWNRILDPKGK